MYIDYEFYANYDCIIELIIEKIILLFKLKLFFCLSVLKIDNE